MDQKVIINNVLTAVVTAAVLGVLGFFMGVFEKGAEAISEDQIEAVLKKVLVTDTGDSYGHALSTLATNDAVILSEIGNLKTDVGDLEDSILDLAGSN